MSGTGLEATRLSSPSISGNTFTGATNGIILHTVSGLTLSDPQGLAGAGITSRALRLGGCDGAQVTNVDMSGNDPGSSTFEMDNSDNVVVQNVNVSAAAGSGVGLTVFGGVGNQLTDVRADGRQTGIRFILQANGTGHVVTRFTATGSGTGDGVFNQDTPNIVIVDSVVGSFANGVRIRNAVNTRLENSLLTGSGTGLLLTASPTTVVFHNNIFGNTLNISSDTDIELSLDDEGNFWGGDCPDELFEAGVDSNAPGVVDSFPFSVQDGWLTAGGLPGCCEDRDGDGYGLQGAADCTFPGEVDCDDADPDVNPATAEICNGLDDDCNDLIDDGLSTLRVTANQHTVGTGTHPGSTKEPLTGLLVEVYDKSEGSCARTICGGISHQNYDCIFDSCDPVATGDDPDPAQGQTNGFGEIEFTLPPGDYLVIGGDGTEKHLGVSASDLVCGDAMQKHLQLIITSRGDRLPAHTTRRTGSELLIVEPEDIVWDEPEELYPFVLDSVGSWTETTTVEPPEGFVRDYDYLTEDVINEIEALQFTLTDVGTDWVPMRTRHILEHNGRVEVVLGEIDTSLEETFARRKGLDKYGRSLDKVGENAPPPVRVESRARLEGWVGPSDVDQDWSFRVEVDRETEISLTLESLEGVPLLTLAAGRLPEGRYEFSWNGNGLQGEALSPGDLQVRIVADGVEKIFRLRLPEFERARFTESRPEEETTKIPGER